MNKPQKETRPHVLAPYENISLCPMCLRPSILLKPSEDILSLERTGEMNLIRSHNSDDYSCRGCETRFSVPLKVSGEQIRKHRAIANAEAGIKRGNGFERSTK